MDAKGNDALLKTTRITEWTLNQGGYISLLFGGFIIAGCLMAYVIAVARGNVDPFLPLISDAAGSPPQNGLFGTLVCIGGMFGVVFMLLRYMIVLEKNREKSKVVTAINKTSLAVGITSMLGITLVTGYPINFYRNREVWLLDVGVPHMIGGVMLFALGIVYIALQCVLTLFLKTKHRTTLLVRVALCLACTAAFVYHMLTVPDNFGGISHLYHSNDTEDLTINTTGLLPYPSTMGASLKLPIDTSGSYVSSAITEWLLVFFFCCFFFTFFNEAQQYSLLIVVETHRSPQDPDEAKLAQDEEKLAKFRKLSLSPQNGAQVDPKPTQEVKKFFRRDSTCQTMTDIAEEEVLKSSKNITNGAKDMKVNKLFDIKENGATKVLAEPKREEKQVVDVEQQKVEEHSVSTSCDDLEAGYVRKDIKEVPLDKDMEKIEILVKDEDVQPMTDTLKTPFLEGNGNMRKVDSDEILSTGCPLSIS